MRIPPDAQVTRNGDAFLAAWLLTPGVVLSAAEGQLTIAMGEALIARLREGAEKYPTIDVFLSWPDVTGYAPKVRADLADFARERPVIGCIHVYTNAAIVSMGLTALRLTTSVRVECYTEEIPFLGAIRRARNITASSLR